MESLNKQFKFNIPLKKSSDKDDFLEGIASTDGMDRDFERMSEAALYDMQREIITKGVNLFGNHEHNWENTLGVIKEATLEGTKLKVGIQLDDPVHNPKIPLMLAKLARGIMLGLSVGGYVTKEKQEYNKELGKKIKVIDGVKLYEISVVGVASNPDTFLSIPMQMAKCFGEKCPACYSKITTNKCGVCLWSK